MRFGAMKASIFCCFILLFFSCKQPRSNQSQLNFKDSVVKEYLASIDSVEFYDTFSRDFRILRAYAKNDTPFFSNLKKEIEESWRETVFYGRDDSCVVQEKLSDLKVDEAYRFRHWEAFCKFMQNITVTLSGSEVLLDYIEYSNGFGQASTIIRSGGDTIFIKPYCTVIKKVQKSLSIKDWENLEMKVREADYWGLKRKGGGGLDGSTWQIDAYVNEKSKYSSQRFSHSVWRHNTSSECFKELGRYMIYLSGEKIMCGTLD